MFDFCAIFQTFLVSNTFILFRNISINEIALYANEFRLFTLNTSTLRKPRLYDKAFLCLASTHENFSVFTGSAGIAPSSTPFQNLQFQILTFIEEWGDTRNVFLVGGR